PGTLDRPFQSLDQAWTAAQAVSGAANITIYIRAGHYAFNKSLVLSQTGGDTSRRILFTAYNNEKVLLTGGARLANSKFHPVTDAKMLNRLPAASRSKVYETDLAQSGISD